MNWILKQKRKSPKALMVALFLVIFFISLDVNNVIAADPPVTVGKGDVQNPNALAPVGSMGQAAEKPGATGNTNLNKGVNGYAKGTNPTANKSGAKADPNSCNFGDVGCYIKGALYGVLVGLGWVAGIAATIFGWAVDPSNMSGGNGVLQYKAIENVWIMVRDTLNMAFILVLLFAAFCTVFQIDKWNLKKVWLNILINALLVNFSFPIARFFIDISNVAMYYFLNNMYDGGVKGGTGIMAAFGDGSKLGTLLVPEGNYAAVDWTYLIAAIIFTFLFSMTMLVLAVMFVIRIIALAMLIMFSPIGFVGYIFPKTDSMATDWWSNLFSYSFFGPIMVFMMAISLKVLEEAQKQSNFLVEAAKNTPIASKGGAVVDPNWIATAAFYTIPIILIWMAMGVAQSMGIAGASTIVGAGKKWGAKLANAPGKYSGVYGGTKKAYEEARKSGKIFGMQNWATKLAFKSGVAGREAGIGGFVTGGPKGWSDARRKLRETENRESIEKGSQSHIDSGTNADQLFAIMNDTKKSKIDRAAAAKAYQRMDHYDRQAHTASTLAATTVAAPYGDHTEALVTTTHAAGSLLATEQAKAKAIADKIKAGTFVKKDEYVALNAYINKHAKSKIADGVKA